MIINIKYYKLYVYMYWYPKGLFMFFQARRKFFSAENQHVFSPIGQVYENLYFEWYVMIMQFFENIQQTRNASPCRNVFECRPELSYIPDW